MVLTWVSLEFVGVGFPGEYWSPGEASFCAR